MRFSVGPAVAPRLSIDAKSISFTYPQGTQARVQSFIVSNEGGGDLPFTVASRTEFGRGVAENHPVERHGEAGCSRHDRGAG